METDSTGFIIRIANNEDEKYAECIVNEMESSAKIRGTGISKRSPGYICEKMLHGNAVIALTKDGKWVGFSYIEVWSNGEFVSNSGLIVNPAWREKGVATAIKERIFQLSRQKYPKAKIFSITTGMAIMKLNSKLGFEPVIYDAITHDSRFWQGCKSCVNYDILQSKGCKNCLCTAMLFDPESGLRSRGGSE
jgi:N-acetylglutamate synthase-like GNAT family acetyltransferase